MLFLGLELAGWNNITKHIVFGESKQVIQKMRMNYRHGTANYRIICNHIHRNNPDLQATYFHILRGNNAIAEKLANQGFKNNLGLISIKGQPTYHKHVP